MPRKKPLKVGLLSAAGLILALGALEAGSISKWSTLDGSSGTQLGYIEYRPGLGELNRFTMSLNEAVLGVFGYRFNGPSFRGTFGRWNHTYAR